MSKSLSTKISALVGPANRVAVERFCWSPATTNAAQAVK
jgi:hypothetical protein